MESFSHLVGQKGCLLDGYSANIPKNVFEGECAAYNGHIQFS
jgi:hypothetical protein